MTVKDNTQYHRLIATAITCLESALTNFRHPDPRHEALIRLKLATLIFEETDNTDKLEEILSKGIASCERARLPDLRYTMQHLLICVLHSKVPKAAAKAVDKIIAEVEALRSHHWTFVFRFLKFYLSVDNTLIDGVALLRQLTPINDLAKSLNKISIGCVTSCLEAMVSLRAGTAESLELAQRSLADARSSQLSPELQKLPQLRAMMSALDMACYITIYSADQMRNALQPMQSEQESASKAKGWREDGCYTVTLGMQADQRLVLDAPGIFAVTEAGELGIVFKWLSKGAMLTVGYMLSGIALLPRNGESGKSETFFREALKINENDIYPRGSLHEVQGAIQHQKSTRANIKMLMASTYAARTQYDKAVVMLSDFNQEKANPGSEVDRARLKFLTASCLQGSGELNKALELYSTWLREFDAEKKTLTILKDLQVLAILNSVHIMGSLGSGLTDRMQAMLRSIESYCLTHPNKSITSVYHVVECTTAPADTTISDIKKSLNRALVPAQGVKNKQLLALIMNMMSETFFTALVGTQAKSSSNAGRTLAKQSGDELWVAVGLGMLRDTLERSGHLEEATDANDQARSAMNALPRAVKAALNLS